MQWEPEPLGGFTEGEPGSPLTDPADAERRRQRGREGSMLELYRALIALRRELGGDFELRGCRATTSWRTGAATHTVALNLGDVSAPLPPAPRMVTASGAAAGGRLAPGAGAVVHD